MINRRSLLKVLGISPLALSALINDAETVPLTTAKKLIVKQGKVKYGGCRACKRAYLLSANKRLEAEMESLT